MEWYAKVVLAVILTFAVWGAHEGLHALPKLIAEIRRAIAKRRGTP